MLDTSQHLREVVVQLGLCIADLAAYVFLECMLDILKDATPLNVALDVPFLEACPPVVYLGAVSANVCFIVIIVLFLLELFQMQPTRTFSCCCPLVVWLHLTHNI